MTAQSSDNPVLQKTLALLVHQVELTPDEVAQLRLSHLHLAGQKPNISFVPAGSDEPKTVELDLEAHRALVGWLVARPDSKGSYLFPGVQAEPMPVAEIERLVQAGEDAPAKAEPPPPAEAAPPPDESPSEADGEPAMPPPPRPSSPPGPPGFRPEPPPSRPEDMGPAGPPPPERLDATLVSRPKSTPAPEESDRVDLPLPTTAPRPPVAPPEADEPELGPEDKPTPARDDDSQATPSSPEPQPGRLRPPAPPGAKKSAGRPGAVAPPSLGAKPKVTAARAAQKAPPLTQKPLWQRYLWPGVLVLVLLPCLVCGGGGWYLYQNDATGGWLAGLLGPAATVEPVIVSLETVEAESAAGGAFESPLNSPLPTPTLPPTATATASPTPTPLPTNTPVQPETPTLQPTDTPVPTDTPLPTDTPAPTNTPTQSPPAATATPANTPTPAMKYEAPVLLEPEDGYAFIQGNTIVLRWEPVGELAPDEQYAVRLIYKYQDKITYQGANIKETEWTIPLSMYGQIDGPDYLYEWFVTVERLNDDGSGTSISPESEHRRFVWR